MRGFVSVLCEIQPVGGCEVVWYLVHVFGLVASRFICDIPPLYRSSESLLPSGPKEPWSLLWVFMKI